MPSEAASPPRRLRSSVILLAAVAAIGGLIFGFDIGGSGGSFVMESFQLQFGWIDANGDAAKTEATIASETGWISALLTLGAAVGAFPSGFLADRYGRRPCIVVSSATFTVGAALQAASHGPPAQALAILYAGRFVGGVGIGMLSATVPVYIAEAAPERQRGMLSTLWQLAIVVGIVLASLVNLPLMLWADGWRVTYGGNGLFAIVLLLQMLCMPESPRWLASRGREAELRAVLNRLRYADEIDAEVRGIVGKAAKEREAGEAGWIELVRHENCMRHRLLVGLGISELRVVLTLPAALQTPRASLASFLDPSQQPWLRLPPLDPSLRDRIPHSDLQHLFRYQRHHVLCPAHPLNLFLEHSGAMGHTRHQLHQLPRHLHHSVGRRSLRPLCPNACSCISL